MLLEEVKPKEQVYLFDEFYLELDKDRSDDPGMLMYTLETFGDLKPVGLAYMQRYRSPTFREMYTWRLEWDVHSKTQGMTLDVGGDFELFREWCINTLRDMLKEEYGTS